MVLKIQGRNYGGWGKASSVLFWKMKKSALILETNGSDRIHLWIEFSIQNVVLRVSRQKLYFVVFLTKCLLKCPNSTKPLLSWKIFGCTAIRWYIMCVCLRNWSHCSTRVDKSDKNKKLDKFLLKNWNIDGNYKTIN